jgi:hypothetical protein
MEHRLEYHTLPYDAKRDAVVDKLASIAAALPPESREEGIRVVVAFFLGPDAQETTGLLYE